MGPPEGVEEAKEAEVEAWVLSLVVYGRLQQPRAWSLRIPAPRCFPVFPRQMKTHIQQTGGFLALV